MSAVVFAEEAAQPASGAAGGAALANEGKAKKFVKDVERRRALCVAERAVFTLDGERLTLREVAPGIGLQRDVLDQMEFTPEIDDDLKETDPGALPKPGAGSRA